MTPDDLVVEVRDSSLQRIGIIPADDLTIIATARHRNVGSYQITVPTGSLYASQLREPGAGLIISLYGKEFLSGPISTPEIKYTTDDAAGTITFTGVSDTIVLNDRIAYPQPSNENVATQNVAAWSYTGPAESAMHQLVKVNAGVNASISRIVEGLYNGHDDAQGVSATYQARWGTLTSYLNSWGGANEIGYHVIQRGERLVFETWTLNDMTAEIRLSVEGGGLSSAKISYSPPGLTHAIVGGSGSGTARVIREYTTTKSTQGALAWDRRIERFIDQSGAANTTEMQTAGLKELNTKGFTVVSAEAIPTFLEHMKFGQDWNVGDYITLEFEGKELDTSVSGAVISAGPTGIKLGVQLGDTTGFNPTARVAGKLEEQTRAYERTSVENEIPTQDIEQAQADISAAQADISTAQTTLTTHSSTLSTHSSTLSTHSSAISTAQADISTAQADISTAQANIATNTSDIAAVQAVIADLESEVDALQTDGAAPSSAPTLVTIGALGQIFVKWAGVSNADPVRYEVHVSDTASFTPSGATLLTTTTATMISAKTEADNTPFAYGTTYYFKARAVDDDGPGSYSAEVSDQMDQTGIADLAVGSVTAEKLESVLVLATKIATASGTGVRVEIDEDGIRSYNSSNELLVEWSAATGLMTWKSAADGERVELDSTGFASFTDDPVPLRTVVAPAGWMFTYLSHAVTILGSYAYVISTEIEGDGARIEKYHLSTGERSGSGSGFITTAAFGITNDGTYLYTIDPAALTIRKWNASSGAEITGSGFPIDISAVGTSSGEITASGSNLFIVDGNSDIRSYQLSNGAARGGNFPIAGTFYAISAADSGAFNACSGTAPSAVIRRYDANGTAVGGAFPVTQVDSLTPSSTASAGGRLLSLASDALVYAYTDPAGVEITQGWPVIPAIGSFSIAASSSVFAVTAQSGSIAFPTDPDILRIYNNAEGFESTRISASDGSAEFQTVTASDIEAAGDLEVSGRTSLSAATSIGGIPHDAFYHTRGYRAGAHTIANNTATKVAFDTWLHSPNTGPYWSWNGTNREWTILVSGLYICSANIAWGSDNTGIRRIRLFAGSFQAGNLGVEGTTATIFQNASTGMIWLDAGNTVYLEAYQTNTPAAALSIASSATWISIARIGGSFVS